MKSAQQPASISAPNHLRIGEYCKFFGGTFAGLMRSEPGMPDYYLFMATGPDGAVDLPWGGYGEEEPGAKHEHDGLANTIALMASKIEHPAAKFAGALKLDGYSDFYLPARQELRLAHINCPAVLGDVWHWSSTQCSAYSAWFQDGGGDQYDLRKDVDYRVRACRRLVIQ